MSVVVEVPEVHHREELQEVHEWDIYTHDHAVPRIIKKTAIQPVAANTVEAFEDVVKVDVKVPAGEIVVEKPRVMVEEKIDYIKGKDCTVGMSRDVIDVPYVVQVPNVSVHRHPVHVPPSECKLKEVIVPNVEVKANIIEDVDTEFISVPCPVEQYHTTRNIRYVPRFKATN